jgi:hypothetical protein
MISVLDDTIGGFNQFLLDQKEVVGEATLSLIQFDNEYEVIYRCIPIKSVPPLTKEMYKPRGSTALLDSLARMINSTGQTLSQMKEEDRPSKVIFVVITDGLENCSKEFTKRAVFNMIEHQKTKYSWEFVYLCASAESITDAISYGFSKNSTITYTKSKRGIKSAFCGLSKGMNKYRSCGDELNSKGFFGGKQSIEENLCDKKEGHDV